MRNAQAGTHSSYLYTQYMSHLCLPAQLLVNSFNPAAAEGVMCRDTVSVGWDGRLYDCDFNQQLALGMRCARALPAAGRPELLLHERGQLL